MRLRCACWLPLACLCLAGSITSFGREEDEYSIQENQRCDTLLSQWRRTHDADTKEKLGGALVDAAVRAQRPAVAEAVLADDRLAEKEVRVPRHARRVRLHELKVFEGVHTSLYFECGYFNYEDPNGWVVRRITQNAFEVWTPTHGWLFDGRGRLLNEARPPRRDGHGREWYGAFLPDGRWVTTDLWDFDRTLTFFSREGRWIKEMSSLELVPTRQDDGQRALIGWARSDQDGTAWIVNVGAMAGYATVRVGPAGPARLLQGIERWQLCYPRALGPRGDYLDLNVPDDTGRWLLGYQAPGHGAYVDYPRLAIWDAANFTMKEDWKFGPEASPVGLERIVPDGNHVFGFWPGRTDVFIGATTSLWDVSPAAARTRKTYVVRFIDADQRPFAEVHPNVDKTWFFTRQGRFQGWVRARRLGDSADGRHMLFRLDDDSRVAALNPRLGVAGVWRFTWANGKTADAVQLFDDLRLGVFVRGGQLVLAGW